MSTDRAVFEQGTPYTAEAASPIAANAARESSEYAAYPPPPSAAECGALVPCQHSACGCPLGVDVRAVTRALSGGDHEGAFRIVRAAHPFASTCGAGCYAPCESACRRRVFGAPVAIAAQEEYAAAFATPVLAAPEGPCTSRFEARSVAGAIGRPAHLARSAARSGKTIAIVGSGAAGLACAHDLALLGHHSIVFETRSEPGGLMTGVIPPFRFSVVSARAECNAVLGLGVEFRGAVTIAGLRSAFEAGADAVFLAIGASRGATIVESGQQHPDILDALDVLSRDVGPLGQTIVAGEGALAMDAARTLVRRLLLSGNQTSGSVQLVLTSPLDTRGVTTELLAACARDGIRIHYDWRVRRVQLDRESGLLSSVDIAASDNSSAQVLPCDRLVLAGSRTPDTSGFAGEIDLTRAGFIATDPQSLRTSVHNVWAGGACVFGHRSLAHAVADGKRAAWEIHAALTGTRVTTTFASAWVEANGTPRPDRGPADRRRALPLMESPSADPFAPSNHRSATRAGEEGARCFDCAQIPVVTGECSSCGRCADICPTGAISVRENRPAIEGDLCNRCGLCIRGCPDGALAMLRAEWEERIQFA